MLNENNGRRSMTGLALKWAHLMIVLTVYLLTMGALYATMRTQLDETRQRLREVEQESIKDPQFREFREDMQRRLQRIEDKLDREKAIRELH